MRWFLKALDGRRRAQEKALSLVPAHYLFIRCFGWKPLQGVHPGNNTQAVNMTNKCERESETVEANQGHVKRGESGSLHATPSVENLDDSHVICKSYFEEAITFNNLQGLWRLDINLTKISSPFIWNYQISTKASHINLSWSEQTNRNKIPLAI